MHSSGRHTRDTPTRKAPRAVSARWAFTLLAAAQLALSMTVTVTSIAGPAILGACALTSSQLVTVCTAYPLSFSALLLFGGRLADMAGRRRMFASGALVFSLGCLLAVPAQSFGLLLAARIVQGCGAALAAPAAMALLGAVFPAASSRTRATAVWGPLASLGAILGVLLGGFAVAWASWRAAFGLLAVAGLAATALAARCLPVGPPPRPSRVDVPGVLLGAAGIALLGHGFAGASHGWLTATALTPLAAGAALLGCFVLVEQRVRTPILPLGLLRDRRRSPALLAVVAGPACGAGTTFVLCQHFQQTRGLTALHTAVAFLPFGLVLCGVGLLAPRIATRFTGARITVTGLVVTSTGLLLLSCTEQHSPYAGVLLVGLMVLPAGVGLVVAGASLVAAEQVSQEHAGLFGGVLSTALQTGPALGIALLVSLSGPGPAGYTTGLTTLGLILLVGAVAVAVGLHGRRGVLRGEQMPGKRQLT